MLPIEGRAGGKSWEVHGGKPPESDGRSCLDTPFNQIFSLTSNLFS